MKYIKCPICGTENKVGAKYCRICFSRLVDVSRSKISLKTDFYPQVTKHKNVFALFFIILLLVLLWLLLK
jgi:hypothetical protein